MLKTLAFILLLSLYGVESNVEEALDQRTTFYEWETYYYDQFVDHFNFRDNRTFKQRYLVTDQWFEPSNGPVFFYPGNEADIELFWNNTGFMFDIAPNFQPLIVFAEHRYYGKTLPFGESSFDLDKIVYLSIEQAIADFAVLLTQIREDYNLSTTNNPIIAFGGSYGGMLAAYMRFKYPNIIQGAIASSAPIYITVPELVPTNYFFTDVSNDFKNVPGCEPVVRNAFSALDSLFKKGDYATISQKFNLCNQLTDPAGYRHLLLFLRNVFIVMAMGDYPYKSSFLSPFPAWPVNASCHQLMNDTARGVEILTAFKNFADILYNATNLKCYDIFEMFVENSDPTGGSFLGDDAKAWDYQMCTELVTTFSSNGVDDIFPPLPYTLNDRKKYCLNKFGISDMRATWTDAELWGTNIASSSNIVFSNGLLDPLHRMSPNEDLSESITAVLIAEGAHHLDLRSSNPADPHSVRHARLIETQKIMEWIEQAQKN